MTRPGRACGSWPDGHPGRAALVVCTYLTGIPLGEGPGLHTPTTGFVKASATDWPAQTPNRTFGALSAACTQHRR